MNDDIIEEIYKTFTRWYGNDEDFRNNEVMYLINKDIYRYLSRSLCLYCYCSDFVYPGRIRCVFYKKSKKIVKTYIDCPDVCKYFELWNFPNVPFVPELTDILDNKIVLNYGITI